jgi:hypothetical protein
LPQGLLKKIEVDLLLPDLPFKLRDPSLRLRQRVRRRRSDGHLPHLTHWRPATMRPDRHCLGLGRPPPTA